MTTFSNQLMDPYGIATFGGGLIGTPETVIDAGLDPNAIAAAPAMPLDVMNQETGILPTPGPTATQVATAQGAQQQAPQQQAMVPARQQGQSMLGAFGDLASTLAPSFLAAAGETDLANYYAKRAAGDVGASGTLTKERQHYDLLASQGYTGTFEDYLRDPGLHGGSGSGLSAAEKHQMAIELENIKHQNRMERAAFKEQGAMARQRLRGSGRRTRGGRPLTRTVDGIPYRLDPNTGVGVPFTDAEGNPLGVRPGGGPQGQGIEITDTERSRMSQQMRGDSNFLRRIETIGDNFDPSMFGMGSRAQSAIENMLSSVLPNYRISEETTASNAMAAVIENLAGEIRSNRFGANLTPEEKETALSMLPDPNDPPDQIQQKFDELYAYFNDRYQYNANALQQDFIPVETFSGWRREDRQGGLDVDEDDADLYLDDEPEFEDAATPMAPEPVTQEAAAPQAVTPQAMPPQDFEIVPESEATTPQFLPPEEFNSRMNSLEQRMSRYMSEG